MDSGGAETRPGGVVQTPVYCRRCGYNLYGLPADGPCPECGLAAWASILHTVDPAASNLPRIRNPGVVGDSLLWLMILTTTSAILIVVRPVAHWIDAMDPAGIRSLAGWTPAWLLLAAGASGLGAAFCVRRMAPPVGEEPGIWRDIRRLGFGLAAWSVLIIAAGVLQITAAPGWAVTTVWLVVAAAAVVPLLGLRGVLRTIGLRSREYRTASGGRQGIRAMIVAAIGAAAGQAMRLVAVLAGMEPLAPLGIVLTSICVLMVMIGLVYLVANAWWIRNALRCPPPRLDQVLGDSG